MKAKRNHSPPPGYLTRTQAAILMGVSARTVMRLAEKRVLPAFRPTLHKGRPKPGMPVFFRIADVTYHMERCSSLKPVYPMNKEARRG